MIRFTVLAASVAAATVAVSAPAEASTPTLTLRVGPNHPVAGRQVLISGFDRVTREVVITERRNGRVVEQDHVIVRRDHTYAVRSDLLKAGPVQITAAAGRISRTISITVAR